VVPDLPLVDVPACVVHTASASRSCGTPRPARRSQLPPACTHLALGLSNGDVVLKYFVV
jgi:hypothetical protein